MTNDIILNDKQDFDLSIFEVKNGMVNLTKIAKHFGKDVRTWTRSKKVQEFIDKLNKISDVQNLHTVDGGQGEQGTFGTEKVALKFAEYISTDFEIWANDKIHTLLNEGKVELTPSKTNEADDYLNMDENDRAIAFFQARKEKARLELETAKQAEQLGRLMAVNKVYTTTEIAKELNLKSAIELNEWLTANKYQYNSNGTWVLYSDYSNQGFDVLKQIELPNGDVVYSMQWTQAGRDWILSIHPNGGLFRDIIKK